MADFHSGEPGAVATWRANGMFSSLYVSRDGGSNWAKIDRPSLQIADIRIFDGEHGASARWNPEALTNTKEIYEYDKARDEWRLVTAAPDGCLNTRADLNHRHASVCDVGREHPGTE